jgi:hypothetical protein
MSMAASLAAALLLGSIEYWVCVQPTTSWSVGIVRRVVVGAGTVSTGAIGRVSAGDTCGVDEEHAVAAIAPTSKQANRA